MPWGAGNATLGESPARLEAGFPTLRLHRGLNFGEKCVGRLTITLSVSRVECLQRPRDQSDSCSNVDRSKRVLYRELVERVTKDTLCGWVALFGGLFS